MNVDAFFSIGSTHHICQDYAVYNREKSYVILSDGCSSAPDSDFGSRLIVKAAEPHVFKEPKTLCSETLKNILNFSKILNIPETSLFATLLILRESNGIIESLCVGDGVIVGVEKTGNIVVIEYNYKSNAPYYLAYEKNKEDIEFYVQECGDKVIKKTTIINQDSINSVIEERSILDTPYLIDKWDINAYSTVAIMSDGVQSFLETKQNKMTGTTTISVPLFDVIKELMAFKNTTGSFVLRRCIKALKTFKEKNWFHADDLSIGVISL